MRVVNLDADVRVAADVNEAVTISRTMALELNARIYVAGGLFVAIEYAHVARGDDATALAFF